MSQQQLSFLCRICVALRNVFIVVSAVRSESDDRGYNVVIHNDLSKLFLQQQET